MKPIPRDVDPPDTEDLVCVMRRLGSVYEAESRHAQREIRVVKPNQSAIIPDRKVQLLRKIGNAQAEIGRLNKLLDEIRAEVLTTD